MDVLKRFFSDNLEILVVLSIIAFIVFFPFDISKLDIESDNKKIIEKMDKENRW